MKIASLIRRTGSVAATVLVLVSLLVSGHTPVAAQSRVAWTGVFTGVVVPKPEPALDDYTRVYFNVSRPLDDSSTHGAELRMFAGDSYIGKCNSGTTCSLNANPARGTSITYHAEVWVLRAGVWVKSETSQSVTVTDPGWTGSFTSASVNTDDEAFLGATTATFAWAEPLQYVRVDIVDPSGDVIATCPSSGSLECTGARVLAPGESLDVHAEARMALPHGGYVTVTRSEAAQLTGMDAEAYAGFILTTPEAQLATLLVEARTAQALRIRSAARSESFCVQVGAAFPGNRLFHSSAPDSTVICMAGTVALLAWMIVELGPDGALAGLAGIDPDDPNDSGGQQPDPTPPPDPAPAPGGSGTNPPTIASTTYCQDDTTIEPDDWNNHIYPRHVDPAVWTGESKFYDSEDVRSLICESLGEHLVHDETGSNGLRARSYEMPREIGARNGVPTRFITVVTRPDGAVHTAYPGLPTGLTA